MKRIAFPQSVVRSVLLLCVGCLPWLGQAEITKSGTIGNETWNTPGETYKVDNLTGPVVIPAGVTLTIGPGVTVKSKYDNKGTFLVQGTLNATGSAFTLKTHGDPAIASPVVVEASGQATFADCDMTVERSGGNSADTTAMIVAKGSSNLVLQGSRLTSNLAPTEVNRGIWTRDTAALTLNSSGAIRTEITGFAEAVLCESTTTANITDTDFAEGTFGVRLDNAAVDLNVTDSTFTDFKHALELPNADEVSLTNITIDQTGDIERQIGVNMINYTSLSVTGAISDMRIGVHVSTADSGQDISGVTFSNCMWDLLAEGNWNPGSRTVAADTTLAVAYYHVDNPVVINAGATLTIPEGVVLDLMNVEQPMFYVDGTLDADGAVFQTLIDNYDALIYARNSGDVQLTDCLFDLTTDYTSGDYNYYNCDAVRAVGDSTVTITGGTFVSGQFRWEGWDWTHRLGRMFSVFDNASMTVQDSGTGRVVVDGFRCGGIQDSTSDLHVDGVNFINCDTALDFGTIANGFVYNVTIEDCPRGIYLDQVGVLVTNTVNCVDSLDAISFREWSQAINPQISTAGVSFDDNSYCRLPTGYVLTGDMTLPARPYRLSQDYNLPGDDYVEAVIPEGVTLTLTPGTKILGTFGRDLFNVYGTLNAVGTVFEMLQYYDTESIEFFGTATGTFTECEFYSDTNSSAGGSRRIFYLQGDSHVSWRGCSFDGFGDNEWNIWTNYAIVVGDTATATMESYGGTPCSFNEFQTAVWANSLRSLPFMDMDTDFGNCTVGSRVNTGYHQVVDTSVTVSCPWLTLDQWYSITVVDTGTLTFVPGGVIDFEGSENSGFIFIDGVVRFEGTTLNVTTMYTYPTFVARNSGRLEFVDSRVNMSDTVTSSYSSRFAHIDNAATLYLDNSQFISTDASNRRTYHGFIFHSPDGHLETGPGGSNHFSGFDVTALYVSGLNTIAGTPDLTFADNARDIEVAGGSSLSSDLTLPANTHMEFRTNYGVTTIEEAATLTIPAGCWVGNDMNPDREKDTLLVKGTIEAVDSLFTVRSSYYDDVEYLDGGNNGSDFMRFSLQSGGTFTNCRFEAHTVDGYWPYCGRIFMLEHQAGVTINGGSFETPFPGGVHRMQTLAYLIGSSKFEIAASGGEGTVIAGFVDAIIVNSGLAELHVADGVFRGNNQGIWIQQFPAAHYIGGNTFIGNETYAINNQGEGILDCRDNFWGHMSGPEHPTNPFGQGDAIHSDVLFLPYRSQGDVEIAGLANHPLGQVPNAFGTPGDVTDAALLRFSVSGTEEPSHCFGLTARITGNEGIADGTIANLRLYKDENDDGVVDGGDTLVGAGAADVPGNQLDFDLEFDLEGNFLIVGDVTGLQSGDALSVGLDADDVILSPAQFIGGSCSDAHHFLDRLVLSAHPAAGFPNQFLANSRQDDLQVFGFQLNAGYAVRILDIGISDIIGIKAENIAGVRLLADTDSDGQVDFGEEWYAVETVTVNGTTGTLHFAFGATPVPTGQSFILAMDFKGLQRDDRLTLGLAPGDIDAGDGVVVTGSVPSATHVAPPPLLVIDAPFQAPNGFVAASSLNDVPLFTFTITPGGRTVEGLTFDLYDVYGIEAADISEARIYVDINQNGHVDANETTTVGGSPVVDINPDTRGAGTLHFDNNFVTQGGDYILVADIANLENDDTLTLTLTSENVDVPANDVVEGGVSPVRHAVYRPDLPEAARQTNWTLTYRSPGGTSVSGAYSHDDSKVVVGYSSGTAYTFEVDSNTPLTMFHKHFDKVQYAGFSADDSQVVTVTYDGAVYIWNAVTGEMENNLFSDLLVRYAVPSPDATKLFIVTEGKSLLLDMQTGAILWEFVTGTGADNHTLYAADYAPDGSKILVGAADKRAYLLDAVDGSVIHYFQGHSQAVTGANFAANGAIVMTSSTDSTVSLFNIGDPVNPISTVTLDGQVALGSGVSTDGTRVGILTDQSGTRRLRMYDDQGLELWNVTLPYTHFTGKFSSIKFNQAGNRVLICSNANSDWNYPAALAVQYSALNGDFLGFVGPRGRLQGWHNEQTYERPRVSEDGSRIFYMHCEGLDVIFPEPGREIIEFPEIANEESFDITPDGRKLIYTHYYSGSDYRLRYYAVDGDRMTLISESPLGDTWYGPLTLSKTGGLTLIGDTMYRTLTGSEFTNSPNPDTDYRSAFSPDESLWGIAFYSDKSIKTMFVGDETGSLEYGVTLTDPYKPVKILYHPDGERVGCVDEYAGVQFYRLDDNTPVGLYDYRSGGGIPRLNDAALSHDGTMLAIARGNSVKLYDMRTGRILRYFYPTHSGQADCRAYSVGFGSRDNMLWIGWSDSYVEIFNRSKLTGLRLNPVTRTLPSGRSQEYTVKAIYDDGSSADVTPEYIYRATGTELAPGARIYADPSDFATIEAGKVTVNPGAGGVIDLTAVYTEGGRTVTARAELTVGVSSLVTVLPNPNELSLSPGVLTPIEYTAVFTDGYEERVTPMVVLDTDSPDHVRIAGNNVTILPGTDPGDIEIYGTYEYDGVSKTATTVIHVHGPESRWERDSVTPGGDTFAMAYSPDGSLLAVGSSSGAVSLYSVGATTTQYELVDVLGAHQRPVTGLYFRSNTELVTVGKDGRICQWNLGTRGVMLTEFQHEAVIMAQAAFDRYLAIGDNLGQVALFDLDLNAIVWIQQQHEGETRTVAIDGSHILSGGEDRKLYLLNRSTGQQEMMYSAFARPPVSAWFEGAQMIVLSEDKRLARWDKGTEDDNLREFFFPSLPTAMILHNGSIYVATTANGANAVWIYDSNGLLTRWMDIPPSQGTIGSLAINPAGTHVLTGRASAIIEVETDEGTEEKMSSFHSCQFWDLNRGSYSGALAHSYSLNDAKISEDGSTLFTQSARRVYRWGLDTGRRSVLSGTKFLETGYFSPYDFDNLEMSSSAAGLVGTRVRGSIYLMEADQRLLHMSVHSDATKFGLTPDGTKMVTNSSSVFARFWDISLDFPTVYYENLRPAFAADVAFIDNEQSLGSISADMFVSIMNVDGLGYSGIDVGLNDEGPGDPPLGGEMEGPLLENMSVSGNGNRAAIVVRYLQKGMMGEIEATHNYVQVYDISDRNNPGLVFETFLGTVEKEIPPVAAALSDDGALFFYGMTTQDGEGHLYDLTAGRELLLFLSPSAGTLSNIGPAAAQFTDGDGALMIAWAEGFAEVFRREGLDDLRLSPAAQSVAAAEVVDMTALVAYADGAEIDVTGRTEFAVTSGPATVSGSQVTINAGASPGAVVTVTGTYTELGSTVQATATLTVQDAFFTHLSIDPPKISMSRGQEVTARVFAHFADASVIEVSLDPGLVWSMSPVGALDRVDNLFTVPLQAQFGDVFVTARLNRDGDEHEVTMAVHIRQEGSMINPGDFDESLVVGFNDLIYFIGHYGETSASPSWDSRCDFDGDGDVDIDDATEFIALYGTDYTPARGAESANLLVAARDSAGAAAVWLDAPAGDLQVGETFELLVYAQDNHPEAHGFRGGPMTILFDPERMEFAGLFNPAEILQPPFNSLFAEGTLKTDRIERLTGLTVADGYGDGEPVLYARIPFRAKTAGLAVFETAPSTCGLALTPPVGKLTLTSTEYSGDSVVVIDLGGEGDTQVVYELVKGWNLVGIPLNVSATRGGIVRDGLQFYTWAGRNFKRTTEVKAGLAYWVHSDQARQLVVTGFSAEPAGLELKKGWNLIAPLTESPPDMPPGVLCMYAWKPELAKFSRPDLEAGRGASLNLQPGEGCWVYCTEDNVTLWSVETVEPRR